MASSGSDSGDSGPFTLVEVEPALDTGQRISVHVDGIAKAQADIEKLIETATRKANEHPTR